MFIPARAPQARTYIREDVFRRQFIVICQGEIEYPEDDPIRHLVDTPYP